MKTYTLDDIEKIKEETIKILDLSDVRKVSYITKEFFEQDFQDATTRLGDVIFGHSVAATLGNYYFKSDGNGVYGCDDIPFVLSQNQYSYIDTHSSCVENGYEIYRFARR